MSFAVVKELAGKIHHEYLDRTLMMQAMWEATKASFNDANVRLKIYNALQRT